MSINLLSSGVIPLVVENVTTSSLNVSGTSSLASLNVSGALSLASLAVSGDSTSATLEVSGASTLASLAVSGASTLATLAVSGASTLMGTGFSNQAVTGVLSLSGGDAGGLAVSSTAGNLNLSATGAVFINQNANRSGTVTANNSTSVNVASTAVTANSNIILTVKTANGTGAGGAYVNAVMPATGFSITNGGVDASVYNWLILN